MPTRAKVTSVEAIESFRTNLIVYLSKARPALDEVSSDVFRTRTWLENEQRIHWEGQLRRRLKKLEEAQAALFSAEISNLREATAAERMSVNKAKRAVDEAEEKLKLIKRWSREFDSRAAPLAKQLGKLQTLLTTELPKAIAHLTQTVNTLHAYAEIGVAAENRSADIPVHSASESKEHFTFEASDGGQESPLSTLETPTNTIVEQSLPPSTVTKEKKS